MKYIYLVSIFISFNLFADANSYYADKKDLLNNHTLKNEDLKTELNNILIKQHHAVGYNSAKRYIFGQLFLQQDQENNYYIQDVYCNKLIKTGVGPGAIPSNDKMNVEHTWPQSKFNGSMNAETQKSDLHHLFPTDSKANSIRSSNRFSDVSSNKHLDKDCSASKSGPSTLKGGDRFFEPPTEHKGNVARALFYFSVRYQLKINSNEQEVLKRWNDIDPVDQAEIDRNNQIESLQGNRNPFVDFPELVSDINRF